MPSRPALQFPAPNIVSSSQSRNPSPSKFVGSVQPQPVNTLHVPTPPTNLAPPTNLVPGGNVPGQFMQSRTTQSKNQS